MPVLTPTTWTLNDALLVVRDLQFKALQCGYHLALCGGVLNKGTSDNDLDLAVLPLDRQGNQQKEKLVRDFAKVLGESIQLGDGPSIEDIPEETVFRFQRDGRVVDLIFYRRR